MSRVENTASLLDPSALKEKIKASIEKIKLKRPVILEQFADFYDKNRRSYQPASLKDFYLFDLGRQFKQLLTSFDIALNQAVLLSDECEQGSDALRQFVLYKARCAALLSDMAYLLQSKSHNDMARQYLFFVNELCVFESKLKDRKQISRPDAYENSIKLFRKTYDEYEKYFNRHNLLPETREICFYIEQARCPDLLINDPGHIDFLFFCMSIAANKLQEKMRIAQNACNQSHQAVLKSLEPVDPDDDYVLDCSA